MSSIPIQTSFEPPPVDLKGTSVMEVQIAPTYRFPFVSYAVESWRYRYLKRAIDILGSLGLITVFAIPGLLIAAAIVLTSRGPVFYREERIGRNGVPFRIWKFRSMCQDAERHSHLAGPHPIGASLQWRMCKYLRDPRITAIGHMLRRWSLDEIPQLFNVLRGEMSMVGPRPIVEAETYLYGKLLKFYLAAIPGMSGLWQVSGRSDLDYPQRAKLDASYISDWSLRSDIQICIRTIPAVLKKAGAR